MKKRSILQTIAVILSLSAVCIGVAVLIGWKFDIASLKNIFSNQVTMKANTAMAIIACGISIAVLTKKSQAFYKYLIVLLSASVLSIAILTLYQYIFHTNFGIDELLFSDKKTAINIGRMSPTTAFCLVNIAITILLSTQLIKFSFRKILIGACCITVIVISGSIFLSYIPNMLMNYHILKSTSMGIHTSFALLLLASSIILFLFSDNKFTWVLNPYLTFICFLGLFFILWATDTYLNSKNETRHNDEVILKTQETLKELSMVSINLAALINSEYSYLNSKDKQFLEKITTYKNAIHASINKADLIIPNASDQQLHLIKLKQLIKKRIDFNSHVIEVNNRNTKVVSSEVKAQEENSLLDEINQTLNQLLNDIDRLFVMRADKLNLNFYQTFLMSPLSSLLVILLLSLGIFTLNSTRYERKKMDYMRNKLASIVDSSSDGIISKNLQGIVTSWNIGAEQIFGYKAKEMIGKPISILFPQDRLNEEPEILKHIIKGEKVEHFETIRKRKDGKLINVSVTISPLKDASNAIIGASKIVRDITDSKRLEGQLRQSQKMGAIGELSGGIAHDFNNLLGIIIGNLDLLERQIVGNEDAMKRAQTALKAANRGADLTKRLLAFSRQQPLSPKPSDLNNSVHNLVEMAAQILGNN